MWMSISIFVSSLVYLCRSIFFVRLCMCVFWAFQYMCTSVYEHVFHVLQSICMERPPVMTAVRPYLRSAVASMKAFLKRSEYIALDFAFEGQLWGSIICIGSCCPFSLYSVNISTPDTGFCTYTVLYSVAIESEKEKLEEWFVICCVKNSTLYITID